MLLAVSESSVSAPRKGTPKGVQKCYASTPQSAYWLPYANYARAPARKRHNFANSCRTLSGDLIPLPLQLYVPVLEKSQDCFFALNGCFAKQNCGNKKDLSAVVIFLSLPLTVSKRSPRPFSDIRETSLAFAHSWLCFCLLWVVL